MYINRYYNIQFFFKLQGFYYCKFGPQGICTPKNPFIIYSFDLNLSTTFRGRPALIFKAKIHAEIDHFASEIVVQPTVKVDSRITSAICNILEICTVENIKSTLNFESNIFFRGKSINLLGQLFSCIRVILFKWYFIKIKIFIEHLTEADYHINIDFHHFNSFSSRTSLKFTDFRHFAN